MRLFPVVCGLFVSSHHLRNIYHYPSIIMPLKRSLSESAASSAKDISPVKKKTSLKRSKTETVVDSTSLSEEEIDIVKESRSEKGKQAYQKLVNREAHIRDIIKPLPIESNTKIVKIISWNVNGFRALMSSDKKALEHLVQLHSPDILCLQETKIQDSFIKEFEGALPGYHSIWNCSTVKKGYSGTVSIIFISSVISFLRTFFFFIGYVFKEVHNWSSTKYDFTTIFFGLLRNRRETKEKTKKTH
jgi:hypothetical protein